MKTLVFLLVLANLLFYAFSAGYFGRPDNPDAVRVEKQVLPERMRIVSRGEAPASPAKAVEPVKPEVVAEAPRAEPVTKVEEPAAVCLAWEHLPPVDAERVASLVSSKFAEFKVVRRVVASEGNGWGVFVPPLAGKADAERKATELRQLGVTDYFIVQDGPIRNAISLGIFSSEKGAQERLAELKEKGVRSARVMPRPGKDSTVNVQATGPASSKEALLAAIGKAVPKSDVVGCK
ncbi:SPOR domain-containing protein [Dechloromonas sp. A34]|uniref:SPOR domain-containing protein n=1 Tax=Dechloromonas sp. A34 TaxID=447588 RepID=UPI0022493866|nr:SPOR domain-containing protein [Dechloromonas sp. A34]